jgi:two-component system OmpR family sensor kinase
MSLRGRLLLGLLAAVFVGVAIVDVLTYTLVDRSQLDQVDQDLERAHPPIERAASEPVDRERSIREVAPGFFVELRTPDGVPELTIALQRPGEDPATLADEVPTPAGDLSDDEAVFSSPKSTDDHGLRVRVSRQSDGRILIIGRSLESIEHTRAQLLVVLLLATAGALVVAATIGLVLVRLGLRPLISVGRAAGEITDTDIDRRVPGPDERTEVGRLAIAINHMLDRLQTALDLRSSDLAALQQSEAKMRQFVADASHELRTPIAATAAYAELFERGAKDRPEDLARAMTGIRSETARMADLVEDLLLLAQLDEGRPVDREPVDVAAVVIEASEAARLVAPERAVSFRIDATPRVLGDAGRLRQVIDNLLGNVRTHTPESTTCQVIVGADPQSATITVVDDGPGMPADDARRAFDRFHRADASRTRASGGAGLGLAIVEAIVSAHDGTVSMESEIGLGTTVVIRLPRLDMSRTEREP